MGLVENAENPYQTFAEQGSAPATPGAGLWRVFTKSDGLYIVDDAGTVTGPFGTGGGGFTFAGARAIRTTTQSITNATTTPLDFDSETAPGWDVGGVHATTKFTVPTGGAGKWTGSGGGAWDTNATNNRYMWWRLNGTTDIPGSASLGTGLSAGLNQQAVCPAIVLADADYVELVVHQDSGGTRTIGAGSLGVGSAAASFWRIG